VDGIKHVLKSFQSSRVVHVKRDANSAAHWLAKEAVTHVIDADWVEDISQIIYDIVSREFSVPNFFITVVLFIPLRLLIRMICSKKSQEGNILQLYFLHILVRYRSLIAPFAAAASQDINPDANCSPSMAFWNFMYPCNTQYQLPSFSQSKLHQSTKPNHSLACHLIKYSHKHHPIYISFQHPPLLSKIHP
jgi:hypothetical protein